MNMMIMVLLIICLTASMRHPNAERKDYACAYHDASFSPVNTEQR